MNILRASLNVATLEAKLFRNFPKLRVSVIGIVLIPALYAFIYLESVWDPTTRTSNLPAAIVNLDKGAAAASAPANVGNDLTRALKESRQFAFYETADAEAAMLDVREGRSLFALLVPADFSASALGAASAGAGKLTVYASEGNNYAGAGFAKRFAEELGHQINETLNEKRWAAMLGATSSSSNSLQHLREGVAKLREDAFALDAGLGEAGAPGQLKFASSQLATGLQSLKDSLPVGAPSMPGTAAGLANSVKPHLEINAPVKNNGMGLAPNFIPVALWIGAVMTAFIFHLRRLPEAAAENPRLSLLLGKLGVLWSINLAQAGCVLLMSWLMLGIEPVNFAGLALTVALTSLTFMLVILALVRAFGDAGKAISLILMVLQLSSAGGVMPVELTNDFYRAISPWLPFTWSIKAVRASAFGALGGEWAAALGVLAIFCAATFLFCLFVGRWKFVPPQEHRPAMDI